MAFLLPSDLSELADMFVFVWCRLLPRGAALNSC